LYVQLKSDAEASGYHLNPDEDFTRDLVEGLLANMTRYGYLACPCRLAGGVRDQDLDIICPCDYRDPDLDQYGTCYCALYVSEQVASGDKAVEPIPERRKSKTDKETPFEPPIGGSQERRKHQDTGKDLPYPVWRCPVCGYLCARERPPEKCPICKADGDRFGKFI
jgi:ferredoxin-thioredoxin reductase catalytic subunit